MANLPMTTLPVASTAMPVRYTGLRSLLPQLDTLALALRNRAYGAPASPLHGGRTLVWQDSGQFAPAGEMRCRLGTSIFHLATDHLSLLEPRLQGFESFVPSEACTALVEHAMAPLLECIEQLAGATILCEDFKRCEPRTDHLAMQDNSVGEPLIRIGFVLLGLNQRPEVRGWMRAAASMWRSLDFSRCPAVPSTRFRELPIGLSVQLGGCRLSGAELRQLEVGDALRISPRVLRQRDGLTVRLSHDLGGFGCRARITGEQLILETPMKPTPDTSPTLSAAASAIRPDEPLLSSIECELTFELGSLRMSLTEISRLRPGQAMHLGVRLPEQPVRILAGGRQIARGELAAVGDEIVVVVTETAGLPNV